MLHGGDLTTREKIELTWKLYIPAAVSGATTIAAIIYANRVETRKTVAAVTAYSVIERGWAEYQAKVVEKIGERKAGAVHDEIMQERVTREPPNREIIISNESNVLCRDDYTGRYFESNVETIRRAENDINKQALKDGWATQTDLFHLIGLQPTGSSDGLGWDTDRLLEIRYTSALTPEGKPCMVLNYAVKPIH